VRCSYTNPSYEAKIVPESKGGVMFWDSVYNTRPWQEVPENWTLTFFVWAH